MCYNLDLKTNNSKLWRIVKNINKEQEQFKKSNSVIDPNGQFFPDDKTAAEMALRPTTRQLANLFSRVRINLCSEKLKTSFIFIEPLIWATVT